MEVLIDPERPGDFNQALMDLGTDIESAKNPRPDESPIRFFSAAYLHGTYDKYPIKLPKKKPKPLQIQAFIIRNSKGDFLLEKNTDGRLLGGFWSFPIMETDFIGQQLDLFETDNAKNTLKTTSQKTLFKEDYQLNPTWTNKTFNHVKHTFSHQKWTIELIEGSVNSNEFTKDKELRWVAQDQLSTYPMATPQKKMLKEYLGKET